MEQEINHFKYGNGAQETSESVVRMPVVIAGRQRVIKAAVVRGKAPVLISRPALKSLNAWQLSVFVDQVMVPLKTNEAGQYILELTGQKLGSFESDEVLLTSTDASSPEPLVATKEPDVVDSEKTSNTSAVEAVDTKIILSREDWGCQHVPVDLPCKPRFWTRVCKGTLKTPNQVHSVPVENN